MLKQVNVIAQTIAVVLVTLLCTCSGSEQRYSDSNWSHYKYYIHNVIVNLQVPNDTQDSHQPINQSHNTEKGSLIFPSVISSVIVDYVEDMHLTVFSYKNIRFKLLLPLASDDVYAKDYVQVSRKRFTKKALLKIGLYKDPLPKIVLFSDFDQNYEFITRDELYLKKLTIERFLGHKICRGDIVEIREKPNNVSLLSQEEEICINNAFQCSFNSLSKLTLREWCDNNNVRNFVDISKLKFFCNKCNGPVPNDVRICDSNCIRLYGNSDRCSRLSRSIRAISMPSEKDLTTVSSTNEPPAVVKGLPKTVSTNKKSLFNYAGRCFLYSTSLIGTLWIVTQMLRFLKYDN